MTWKTLQNNDKKEKIEHLIAYDAGDCILDKLLLIASLD